MLGFFVNTMTADDKYFLRIRDNLTQPIGMQLPKKQKTFYLHFLAFLKSRLIFELFQKNMTLMAYVFSKLQAANDVVTQMSTKFRFRRPLEKRHVFGTCHVENGMPAPLPYLLITVMVIQLEHFSLSDIQNLRTAC